MRLSFFRRSNHFVTELLAFFPVHGRYNTVWREADINACLPIPLYGIFYKINFLFTVYYLSMWVDVVNDILCMTVR
jgi:hypothetical protein